MFTYVSEAHAASLFRLEEARRESSKPAKINLFSTASEFVYKHL
jgi:hypothetical protein